jgi:hypothetical protein
MTVSGRLAGIELHDRQGAVDTCEPQDPVDDPWTTDERELYAGLASPGGRVEQHAQARAIHERESSQVENESNARARSHRAARD